MTSSISSLSLPLSSHSGTGGYDLYVLALQECRFLSQIRKAVYRHIGGSRAFFLFEQALGDSVLSHGTSLTHSYLLPPLFFLVIFRCSSLIPPDPHRFSLFLPAFDPCFLIALTCRAVVPPLLPVLHQAKSPSSSLDGGITSSKGSSGWPRQGARVALRQALIFSSPAFITRVRAIQFFPCFTYSIIPLLYFLFPFFSCGNLIFFSSQYTF